MFSSSVAKKPVRRAITAWWAALLLVAGSPGVQAATAGPAGASFAGANGKIYYDTDYGSANEIYSVNPDGTGVTQLTSNAFYDGEPQLSADGLRLAFISDRSGSDQVWTMNPDGSGAVQVTTTGVAAFSYYEYGRVAWSPTGQILYTNTSHALVFINPDGTGATALTSGGASSDSGPSVSNDGTKVAFSRVTGSDRNVWTINANGTGAAR